MQEHNNGEAPSNSYPMTEGCLLTILKLQRIQAKLARAGHHDLAADIDRRLSWYSNRKS